MPESCKAGIIALGPGIEVTATLFFIQYFNNLKPGSETKGDPASEINTIFLSLN